MSERSTHSRRAFFEKLFTGTVVAVAAPSVILGAVVPKLRFDKQGKMLGDYVIDLNNASYVKLKTVGGSLKLQKISGMAANVIVTQPEAGVFTALLNQCSHEQTSLLNYDSAAKTFTCSAQQVAPHTPISKYDGFGKFIQGPTNKDLTSYPINYNASANTLTITLPVASVFNEDASVLAMSVRVSGEKTASVEFKTDRPSHILLAVFDVNGKELGRLLNDDREAGTHRLQFDMKTFPAGTYFFRLQSSTGYMHTERIVLR